MSTTIATGRAAPPAWPEAMGTYPPALAEIVMRALAPDADDRFPTMQAFQIALESFARGADLALSTAALAAYVQELFADELAAWQAAQRAGKSLGEHLAAKPAVIASADPADRTATDGFATANLRAKRLARGLRITAIAAFAVLCAVGGAALTKHWKAAEPAAERAAGSSAEPTPRSAAPGAERNPATGTTAEKSLPPAGVVSAGAATTTTVAGSNTKTKARVKPAMIRQGRAGAAGEAASGPRPTADSRLGSWDPDSPVPP